ncbi:MAG: 5'/3'-nucleotidase SurE [Thermosulfidibacteraceae bacterium]|jgi:5'-nucleotidase
MLILLSNDDGVFATGINVLFSELSKIADVWIVAPDREKSASSHSLTLHRPLRAKKIEERIYAVDGTPTDSVILGVHKILPREPDFVVSGINEGPNLGEDVTYSGTVSAAMEGCILGIPSVAVSLAISGYRNFKAAARIVVKIMESLFEKRFPDGIFLNINVPDVEDIGEVKGIKWTRLGKRKYNNYIHELRDPRGDTFYWIGGLPEEDEEDSNGEGTDIGAVRKGYVSVTPIRYDMTALDFLEKGIWEWDVGLY